MLENIERLLTSAEELKARCGDSAVESSRDLLRVMVKMAGETLYWYEQRKDVYLRDKKRLRCEFEELKARVDAL